MSCRVENRQQNGSRRLRAIPQSFAPPSIRRLRWSDWSLRTFSKGRTSCRAPSLSSFRQLPGRRLAASSVTLQIRWSGIWATKGLRCETLRTTNKGLPIRSPIVAWSRSQDGIFRLSVTSGYVVLGRGQRDFLKRDL